jgi:hypothetical protein
VAVQSTAVAGAFASLAGDAGSGLAVRAAGIVVLLAAASGAWWVARRRAARFRPLQHRSVPGRPQAQVLTLTSAELSHELGARGTFVQFSSATCATCPQVRRVLAELAAAEPGVVHVDLASEDHMDLTGTWHLSTTLGPSCAAATAHSWGVEAVIPCGVAIPPSRSRCLPRCSSRFMTHRP